VGSNNILRCDKDLNFFFLTHVQTTKYRNIQENPQGAITIADNELQSTVQAEGIITEVPIGPEHDHALRMLTQIHPPGQFAWTPPVTKMAAGELLLLKLTPKYLRFSNFIADNGAHIAEIVA